MDQIKITFIIGQLTSEEMDVLNEGLPLISKMILSPEDYKLFRYMERDSIQVETDYGNRLWCTITHLEILEKENDVILIFTLIKADRNQP
jgi:hypothetical protein